jgi:nicotinamide riboside kinase
MRQRFKEALYLAKTPYVLIDGNWDDRFKKAVEAIEKVMTNVKAQDRLQ